MNTLKKNQPMRTFSFALMAAGSKDFNTLALGADAMKNLLFCTPTKFPGMFGVAFDLLQQLLLHYLSPFIFGGSGCLGANRKPKLLGIVFLIQWEGESCFGN